MTSESRKHRNTVKHLFTKPEEKQKPQFTFSDIAKLSTLQEKPKDINLENKTLC